MKRFPTPDLWAAIWLSSPDNPQSNRPVTSRSWQLYVLSLQPCFFFLHFWYLILDTGDSCVTYAPILWAKYCNFRLVNFYFSNMDDDITCRPTEINKGRMSCPLFINWLKKCDRSGRTGEWILWEHCLELFQMSIGCFPERCFYGYSVIAKYVTSNRPIMTLGFFMFFYM
jgi:hypothetical protein